MPSALANDRRAALAWLYGFLARERGRVALLALFALAATALALAQPWLTKRIIDDGLLARDRSALAENAALLFAAAVLGFALSAVNRLWHTRLSGRVLFALREEVYRHLLALPQSFHRSWRTGDLLARLDGDVAEIQRFAVDTLFTGLSAALGLVGALALMAKLDVRLALAPLLLAPAEALWLWRMRPRVVERSRALRARAGDLSSLLAETLPAVKTLQSAGAEQHAQEQLARANQGYLRDLLRLQRSEIAAAAAPRLLLAAARAGILLVGGWLVIDGQLALGSLVAFGAYLAQSAGPVQSLLGIVLAWQRLVVSLERVWELRRAPAPAEPAAAAAPHSLAGDIDFEAVSFAYLDGTRVLDGASARIAFGKKTALRGASGIGKTTLVDLLLGHERPSAGRISIAGCDLRSLPLSAWRARVALVPQDVVIFRGTLADNLRLAARDASDAELEAAAVRAGLGELLARSGGLAARLAERGQGLSGGERQRIAIARALLQRPLLVILDEPTSQVDAALEARLLGEIDALFGSCTRLVISHRDAPLASADAELELREGKLVERGR